MTDRPIRFAVVGLGMGVQHCKDLLDARSCELAAICDTDAERLEKNRQQFNVKATDSLAEILRDPEIDVVNICTPSGAHAEHTIAALKAGKHVVCEKPPDVTVDAVDRMIAAKQETGRKLMVIFQARFEPVNRAWRDAIQTGRLGKLIGAHGTVNWYRAQSYFNCPGMWKGTWQWDGGGSLANQGVHTVDLLTWLAGPVVEVYGKFGVYAHDIETEDKTVAVLTFANGALGTLTTTTAAYPGLERQIFVHGTEGSVQTQDEKLVRWLIRGETKEAEQAEQDEMLRRYGRDAGKSSDLGSDPFAFSTRGHLAQFEAMAEAIRNDTTPPNDIETARHTVEVMNAIYESGRTGLPVRIGHG